ncbi:MAG: phage major tail protein, TP901-1 family, partial [Alphaproteobacteria bacterium]
MAAQKGRLFLLKQGTAAAGTTIAGLRATRFRVNQDTVDATTKDSSNQWRELLAQAGVRALTIEAAGIFQDAAVEETVRGYAFAGTANPFGLVFENGDKI